MPTFPSDPELVNAGTRITLLFKQANREVSDDWCSSVWIGRYLWDRFLGLSHETAIQKHEVELKHALGLNPGGSSPIDSHSTENALRPLHLNGREIMSSDNRLWRYAGFTDFLLLKRLHDGEDLRQVLTERVEVGANNVRVLGMVSWGPSFFFSPLTWSDYYETVEHLFDLLAAFNLRCEFVALACTASYGGQSSCLPDLIDQQRHFARIGDICKNKPNILLELVNEYDHPAQRMDITRFTKPAGVITSHGSATGDHDPALPPWDYITFHPGRNGEWMRKLKSAREYSDQYNVPCVSNEPMGADEITQFGRRDSDPEHFFNAGAVAGLLSTGATFHSEAGLTSELLTSIQRTCAQSFFSGLSSIPVEARTWRYTRGGLGDCPVQHQDLPNPEGALRTFVMQNDVEAWGIAVQPGENWKLHPVKGTVAEQKGNRGNVFHLKW